MPFVVELVSRIPIKFRIQNFIEIYLNRSHKRIRNVTVYRWIYKQLTSKGRKYPPQLRRTVFQIRQEKEIHCKCAFGNDLQSIHKFCTGTLVLNSNNGSRLGAK